MRDLTVFVIELNLPCALISLDLFELGFLFCTQKCQDSLLSTGTDRLPFLRIGVSFKDALYSHSVMFYLVRQCHICFMKMDVSFVLFLPGGKSFKYVQFADNVTCIVSSLPYFKVLCEIMLVFLKLLWRS